MAEHLSATVPTSGTVTRLVVDPHRRGTVNVFLDDRYAFGLSAALAAGLGRGQHLAAADVVELRRRDTAERAVNVAAGYLARRPRSTTEVRTHLIERSFTPDEADRACSRLGSLGYLDDAAFADWWVANRTEHRPRGRLALRHELSARGVSRPLVDAALEALQETPLASGLARRQGERYRHLGRYDFDQRIGAYLQRRGFAMDAIRAALDDAWAHLTGNRGSA